MSKSDMEKYPEERQILIHPLPLVPVSKCMEGSSVLTDIIIGKFMYHLPFYRLTQQYRESGIGISESTMCGWYEMAVEKRCSSASNSRACSSSSSSSSARPSFRSSFSVTVHVSFTCNSFIVSRYAFAELPANHKSSFFMVYYTIKFSTVKSEK